MKWHLKLPSISQVLSTNNAKPILYPKSTQYIEIILFIFTNKNDTDSQEVQQNGTEFTLPGHVVPKTVKNYF